MGYLVCKKCGSYYALQEGELPNNFAYCRCKGKLKYYDNLEDFFDGAWYHKTHKNQNKELVLINELLKRNKEEEQKENEIKRGERLKRERNYQIKHAIAMDKEKALNSKIQKKHYKSAVAIELIGDEDHHEKEELMKELDLYQDIKSYSQCDPHKSERFLTDTGLLAFIFSVSLFSYGIAYNFLPLNIMGICAVLFAFTFYLTSKNEKITEPGFMQNIYMFSGVFFTMVGLSIIFFMINNWSQFLEFRKYSLEVLFVILIMALATFYYSINLFMSYNTPDMPFNPKYTDKDTLGAVIKNQFSIYDLILVLVIFSVIISAVHLNFKPI